MPIRSSFIHLASVALALCFAGAVGAQLPPEEALKKLKPAEGVEVTLFAAEPDLVNPTAMDIDADGRVWVTEGANYRVWKNPTAHPEGDRIRVLEDTDGDGRADKAWTYWQDKSLQSPIGIAVLGTRVYVCQSPELFYLEDTDSDGKADKKTVVLTGFGGVDHDHAIHGVMFGPDGHLYISNGDEGLDVTDKQGNRVQVGKNRTHLAASVLRTDLEGNRLELLAEGLRNPYEPTVDSFGNVFISDNDDDGNEQCRIVHVMNGGNYGYWPKIRGDRRKNEVHWNEDQPGVIPKILRTGFGSPTGLLFYEGALLPERFHRTLIHSDAGPHVVRSYAVEPKGASFEASIQTLLDGGADSWFRPSDVTVAPDGSVFVCDWYDAGVGGHHLVDFTRGRVYRIAPPGARYEVKRPNPAERDGFADALASPNLATRYLAHEIARESKYPFVNNVLLSYFWGQNPVLRARAIWLLAARGERGANALAGAAADRDPEMRALAVRIIASQGVERLRNFPALLDDDDAGVRREVLIQLARADHKDDWAGKALIDLALRHGEDRFYREAVGLAMKGRESWAFAELKARIDGHWDQPTLDLVLQLHPPEALGLAREVAANPRRSDSEREIALRTLAAIGGEEAGEAIVSQIKNDSPGRVKLAAMALLSRNGGEAWRPMLDAASIRPALSAMLHDTAMRPAALEFVTETRRGDAAPDLFVIARDTKISNDERLSAIEVLGRLAQARALPEAESSMLGGLKDLTADPNPAIARGALGSLANLRNDAAQQLLREVLVDSSRPQALRAEAVRQLGGSRSGALLILKLAEDQELAADLTLDATNATHASPHEDIRMMAQQLLPRDLTLDGKPVPPIAELLAMKGDAARGREAFFREDRAQCFRCHKIAGEGKDVGPDLSKIGAKLGRDALFESILNPSAAVQHEYQVYLVRTRSRGLLSGYIRSESPDSIELMESSGNATRVPAGDVIERTKSQVSLMPTGLTSGMTTQDLVDIVEYLSTLR